MEIRICKNPAQLGASAAKHVAGILNQCIAEKGCARIALSTGASQFDTIAELVKQDVIYFVSGGFCKPYHKGWFLSWPLRTALRYLENGILYRADKIQEVDNAE